MRRKKSRGNRKGNSRLAVARKYRKRIITARKKVKIVYVQPAATSASEALPTYDQGYDQGYDKGFSKGFRDGKHTGGDAIVDKCLPKYQILPEVSVEQLIAAGVERLRSQILHLLTAEQLGDRIVAALNSRAPFSLVRLGDGELLTMAQETIMPIEQILEEGPFLPYAGVNVPNLEVKGELVKAIRGASVVGIPKLRVRNFQPLAFSVFRTENIDYHQLTLTDSLVNYYLYQTGYLSRITQGRRVLVVGNQASQLAEVLRNHNVTIAGEVTPVHGVTDIPRIKSVIAQHDFDLALVSAGVSAVILSEWIASEMGKVAIDFGHLADAIVVGEAPYR
ncbi:GT-D fold domain-containing glycosyltransferase [Paenibacillus sp. yr247]|uniref:GT-D fold domain-containing protein n=1 Tax=Paenibacillus sp. yr247 TaxID=1761880 RepID=UPI0020C89F62|nr:GT-D fold domain-containing glycosyltransferase [Paenibacillus sp. yr247]